MTREELTELRRITGCGNKSIYRVAHIVGRKPHAWELLLYSTRRGRPAKFVLQPSTLSYEARKGLETILILHQNEYDGVKCYELENCACRVLDQLDSRSTIINVYDLYRTYIERWGNAGSRTIWERMTQDDRDAALDMANETLSCIICNLRTIGGV